MADPVAPSGNSAIADATALQDIATNGSLLNQATSRLIQALERMANLILPADHGGTGISSYTVGDLLYADSTTTLAKLPDVAVGKVLASGGVGVAPLWSDVPAGSISGVVPVPNGGTGFSSYTVGDLLYADTTTTLAKLPDVATGNALISGGVGVAPSYGKIALGSAVSGELPLANGGTGASLSDPGADRIMFWDDSAGVVTWLTVGSGLTITDTTITGASIVVATSQTATGSTIDFTGIPSTAKAITVMFNNVGLNASNNILVQLGTSGGFVTTGYVSASEANTSTAGFIVNVGTAATNINGVMQIFSFGSNAWVENHGGSVGGSSRNGSGVVTLSDTLTQVRVTTTAGTFDAGSINIQYQ